MGRDSPHLVPALHRWNAAFTPALAAYLRQKQHYLDDHLAAVLPEHELEWLRGRGSPPIAVLQVGMGHGLAARPALHRQRGEACHAGLTACCAGLTACHAGQARYQGASTTRPTCHQVLSSLLDQATGLSDIERQQIEVRPGSRCRARSPMGTCIQGFCM